jgi:hypothetical protein
MFGNMLREAGAEQRAEHAITAFDPVHRKGAFRRALHLCPHRHRPLLAESRYFQMGNLMVGFLVAIRRFAQSFFVVVCPLVPKDETGARHS